jgi:hypothetical protein
MTLQDLHIIVTQGVDNLNAEASDALHEGEISLVLQMMQNSFIREFLRLNKERKTFESDTLALTDLAKLIEPVSELSPLTQDPKYLVYQLPANYRYPIELETITEHDSVEFTNIPARIIEQDKLGKVLQNPYSNSHFLSPVSVVYGSLIKVFLTKKFTVKKAFLTYLRKPEDLTAVALSSIISDFSDEVYEIIARKAIQHILENYQSPRFQTNIVENEFNK